MNKPLSSTNKILLYGLGAVLGILFIYFIVIPSTIDFVDIYFEEGIGLKSASVISFFVSIATILLFAMVGGDGLLGEVQYMFAAFFGLFLFLWIGIAWAF